MGGDPHFSVILKNGQLLCFSVQGEHNFTFNLISSKFIHINARFDQDSKRPEVTWIGSLGVVINTKKNTTKIRFESSTKTIHINNKATMSAGKIDSLVLEKGRMTISEASDVRKRDHSLPEVNVVVVEAGISFSVKFMKSHIDMVWHKTGNKLTKSHGMIGNVA